VAVVSLSLGIAANTTIFSFVNALLLRPPPVDRQANSGKFDSNASKPARLWSATRNELSRLYLFPRSESVIHLAGCFRFEPIVVAWNRNGVGQAIQWQFVSGNFFGVCGVNMELGRSFSVEEDRQPGAAPVAVISHAFWKNSLGSDRDVLGRTMTVNGIHLSIVGVAPAKFTGLRAGMSPDLWVPFMNDPEWSTRTDAFQLIGLGRLQPGLNPAQAEAELSVLTRQLEQIDPKRHKDIAASVVPTTMLTDPFRGIVWSFMAVLLGAVYGAAHRLCERGQSDARARMSRRGKWPSEHRWGPHGGGSCASVYGECPARIARGDSGC
jgi:hypothetical protein